MGTSVSHRSPATSNWRAVGASYADSKIPRERIVREIWRAATNQPEGNIAVDLGADEVRRCAQIAKRAESSSTAAREVAEIFLSSPSLAIDIAQRALTRAMSVAPPKRQTIFAEHLFAETMNYLVSRDLAGFIGTGDRLHSVSDALRLKVDLIRMTERVVRESPPPKTVARDGDRWRTYVDGVVRRLTGKRDDV